MSIPLEGLRTVIYPAPGLDSAKQWWTALLGIDPYFDQPFYVGFSIAGYELALCLSPIQRTVLSSIGESLK